MKSWAFIIVFVASILLPLHQAEAKKAPKRKVVVINFSESDAKATRRGPASAISYEDQKEMEAEARHVARLTQADYSIPEL